jgi:hypothetical protein
MSLIPFAPFTSREATVFTYHPEVYKKAWARDIKNNYGNMKDFRTWESWNIQPD